MAVNGSKMFQSVAAHNYKWRSRTSGYYTTNSFAEHPDMILQTIVQNIA